MSDPQYTPDTNEVRRDFVMLNEGQHPTLTPPELSGAFDRWLNRVRADARRQGRAMGWDDAAVHIGGHNFDECDETDPPNPYREGAE